MRKVEKIQTLCVLLGYESPESLIENLRLDAVMPGICMNQDCDCLVNVEGDQRRGYCDECHTNSVTSVLILLDLI